MEKRIVGSSRSATPLKAAENWLDLRELARVEVSSEHPAYPVEGLFQPDTGRGWRAGAPGPQVLRLVFHAPVRVHRLLLRFTEYEQARTQEFTLRWRAQDPTMSEIVRQPWNFSPEGSTEETEDYRVTLEEVAVLELAIRPGQNEAAVASLAEWHLA